MGGWAGCSGEHAECCLQPCSVQQVEHVLLCPTCQPPSFPQPPLPCPALATNPHRCCSSWTWRRRASSLPPSLRSPTTTGTASCPPASPSWSSSPLACRCSPRAATRRASTCCRRGAALGGRLRVAGSWCSALQWLGGGVAHRNQPRSLRLTPPAERAARPGCDAVAACHAPVTTAPEPPLPRSIEQCDFILSANRSLYLPAFPPSLAYLPLWQPAWPATTGYGTVSMRLEP